jgi:hypothetical protein
MSSFLLPQHVHICVTAGVAVLLDLRSNRYFGLDQEQTRALHPLVAGWPVETDGRDKDIVSASHLANNLTERGLLTRDTSLGKPAFAVQLPRVERRLVEWDKSELSEINGFHVIRFAHAVLRATISLRLQPFWRVVARFRSRNAQCVNSSIELERTTMYTRIFRSLRPFFYTANDRCLFDSIVMLEFLSMYGIYPTWVIGVKTIPFAAHSWIQLDSYVLNGGPEYVRAFTPILAI